MMIGRNDPCPCGSGRKYKNCCLSRPERAPRSWVEICLGWLEERHRRGLSEAIDEFYSCALFDEESGRRFQDLPEDVLATVSANCAEWLLAEGEIEAHGVRRRIADLLLGPGGPPLAAQDREWLRVISDHPMSLYEVQESVPGEGVWLKDVAQTRGRRLWVVERMGSQSLVRWDNLGARIVPKDKAWQFSGALYPIPNDDVPDLKAEVRSAQRAGRRHSLSIVGYWLSYLVAPPAHMPTLVDAGSSDPVLLVTDHYDVTDWDALAAAFDRQPDVHGDRVHGWVWLEGVEGHAFQRSRLSLHLGKGNRLEVFARTLRRAEEGAAWLREVADSALSYRAREVVDPLSALQQQAPRAESTGDFGPVPPEIHQDLYRNWADEPVPALGGLTPRQSIQSRSGRRRVIDLLKMYEQKEERAARKRGHEPASFRFLWEELGISPPL